MGINENMRHNKGNENDRGRGIIKNKSMNKNEWTKVVNNGGNGSIRIKLEIFL